MSVAVLVERRYLRQHMPGAMIRALTERGAAVDVICPEGCRFHPEAGVLLDAGGAAFDLNRYDAMVARTRNAFGLAVLSYAGAAGILAINSAAATERVRNKACMGIALQQAGIPCAPTILAAQAGALADLPASCFPLLLKATFGDNSQGIRLIRHPEDLADLHWSGDLVLAQQYVPNDGFDLKLYVCGARVWAVRKPSPLNGNPQAAAQPVRVDARMADLALRCGQVFGLEIYGVDTIETAHGLSVIEVNEFPNFTSVPGAGAHLAEHVLGRIGGWEGVDGADRVLAAQSVA